MNIIHNYCSNLIKKMQKCNQKYDLIREFIVERTKYIIYQW